MKHGKRAFFISFLISAFGFGTFMILLLNFWNPLSLGDEFVGYQNDQTLSQAQSMGIPSDKGYMAIYFTLGERSPHCFFLLGHDPVSQTLTVQQISPGLISTYRGEDLPMAALHKIFGVRSVERGLENAMNIDISSTVFADREGMNSIFSAMGSISLFIDEEIQYEEIYSQKKFQLTKGNQSLSPSAILGLLNVYEKEENWDEMQRLICEIIRQKGSSIVSSQRIADLVFSSCETNMSIADVTLALPSLQNLFSQPRDVVIMESMIQ